MNTPQQQFCNGDYLDVTEFILKEHNPDDSSDSVSMPTIQIVVEVGGFSMAASAPTSFYPLSDVGCDCNSGKLPPRTRSLHDIALVEGPAPRKRQ